MPTTSPIQRIASDRIVNAMVPIAALKPHPQNFNLHPEAQLRGLKQSNHDLGQFQSQVVWAQPDGSYIIVSGHGYIEGARRDGETEIRVDILPEDTPPETIEAILAAANLHQRNSTVDDEMLARLLHRQKQAGANLAALGSDEEAVRDLFKSVEQRHAADFLTPFLQQPAASLPRMEVPFAPSSGGSQVSPTSSDEEDPSSYPWQTTTSPVEAREEPEQYFQFILPVTAEQRSILLAAIAQARTWWSLSTSQEAMVQICQQFLAQAETQRGS